MLSNTRWARISKIYNGFIQVYIFSVAEFHLNLCSLGKDELCINNTFPLLYLGIMTAMWVSIQISIPDHNGNNHAMFT